jgi:hypothetical protein
LSPGVASLLRPLLLAALGSVPVSGLAGAGLAATASPSIPGDHEAATSHAGAGFARLPGIAELDRLAAESSLRWERNPHGQTLLRILPERVAPSMLPEPGSVGARLTALYCVQCHHLPSPAMHDAGSWPRIVERMLPRMRGEGNMGRLMTAMMLGPGGVGARPLAAPDVRQTEAIVDYLVRHAMRPLEPSASPVLREGLATADGRMFAQACGQCHVLPDPAAHAASEWPAIVERMEQNMQWMNRVAGGQADPREPQLQRSGITAFLVRHAPGKGVGAQVP